MPVRQFYVRVRGTPEQAAQSIRSIVHQADPALPITYLRTVGEQVNRSLNTERILATLSGGFGALALLLSLVGLYGVMSFVVTQRTREIGIRIALGARGSAAVWLVLRDAMVMIAAGTAVALPSVGLLGRLRRVAAVRRDSHRSRHDHGDDAAAGCGGVGRGAHSRLSRLDGEPHGRVASRVEPNALQRVSHPGNPGGRIHAAAVRHEH